MFEDLLKVLDKIDPPASPTEVGTDLRDKAKAFVEQGMEDRRWSSWADAYKLLEEHDDEDEPDVEGLEAFGYDYAGNVDDANEVEGSHDEESDSEPDYWGERSAGAQARSRPGDDVVRQGAHAHDFDEDPVGGRAPSREAAHGDEEVVYTPTSPIELADAGASGEPSAPKRAAPKREAPPHPREVDEATRVMMKHAVATQDDALLRRMRDTAKTNKRQERENNTEVALALQAKTAEQREAIRKRRKEAQDAHRLAADASASAQAAAATAAKEKEEARTRHLQEWSAAQRLDEELRRKAAVARAFKRWLQTEFAVITACTLINDYDKLSEEASDNFARLVKQCHKDRLFRRRLDIPDLWEPDFSLSASWAQLTMPFGRRHVVRCGIKFQQLIQEFAALDSLVRDPADCLLRLIGRFMPFAPKIFVEAFTPAQLLANNDFIMEKAFLYAVVALSKWLGEDRWPAGFYGHWPPPMPAHIHESAAAAEPTVHILEPRDRVGAPAASSTD